MKIKQKHPVLNLMTEIQRDAVGFSVIAQGKVPVVKSIENFQYGGKLFDFTIFPAHELLPFFRKIRRTASPPAKYSKERPSATVQCRCGLLRHQTSAAPDFSRRYNNGRPADAASRCR